MIKISTFYEHIIEASQQKNMTVKDILGKIIDEGIVGLEIDLDRLLPRESQQSIDILDLMAQNGMEVSCIYGFYDMAHKDETERIHQHISLAKDTHAVRVMPIPGFFSEEEAEQLGKVSKNYQSFCEFYDQNKTVQGHIVGLKKYVEMAKKLYPELKVTVEDFDAYNSPIATIWGLRYYLEHVKGLFYTLDCGNLAFSNENILDAIEELGQYIVHVHCKDRGEEKDNPLMRGEYLKGLAPIPVGQGYIPFDTILEHLAQNGYEGYYAIEHFGAEDQLTYLLESIKYLKRELIYKD